MNRTVTSTAGIFLVVLIGYLLIAGRGLLIPIVIALFIWNLLNTLNNAMRRIPRLGLFLPGWLSMLLSLLVVVGMGNVLIDIITDNVNDVITASSRYQENLVHIMSHVDKHYRLRALASFNEFLQDLKIQDIVVKFYGVFTTLTGSAVLIGLYVVFLFVEQHFFKQKMDALFPQAAHRKLVDSILSHITNDTQMYLGIKTLLSVSTALVSWIIMKAVGLDFAEFWALLIFFLNYIPNIGAMVATIFPALLALVQFESWVPFAVITSGFAIVHFVVGNLLEPRLLGNSLNLSPLVILFALALWGAIWGILGMFLAVPITVMMLILSAHFESTRPIAVLLSQNGYVEKSYQKMKE